MSTSPTAQGVMEELRKLGSASYKGVLMRNHGVGEPCFGVKISDLESKKAAIAAAGWNTLSGWTSRKPDAELDLEMLRELLEQVRDTIHASADEVKYAMNSFIITIGAHVQPLNRTAIECAEEIGRVTADLGNNACKIPEATGYLRKIEKRGGVGKKRAALKC